MKQKIILIILPLLLGGVGGYVIQQWTERSIPILQIASVSFEEIKIKDLNVVIPEELQKMSKESHWFDTLDKEISYKELTKKLNDISETVVALDNMTSTLPKMRKYAIKNQNDLSIESARKYREYVSKNIDTLSLSYLTMHIASLIKKNEIKFELTKDFIPVNTFIPIGKKSLEEVKESLNSQTEKSAIFALQIVVDWHPKDLIKALNIIIERTGEQAIHTRKIMEGLSKLAEDRSQNIGKDYFVVNASISNNGVKAISFQKYAIVSLSGLSEPIFLEAIKEKNGLFLPQGKSKEIEFRSRKSLPSDLSKKLKTMYETDFIKCKIALKLLTHSNFSDEWVYSEMTSLSSFNKKLEREYKSHAPSF